MSRRARIGVIAGVSLALVPVAGWALARVTREPSGPDFSSYATAPRGVAAYASLLGRLGHPVARLRKRPADAALDPAATVILLEPDVITSGDIEALRAFVRAGGRLVGSPSTFGSWPQLVGGGSFTFTDDDGATARRAALAPEVAGVVAIDKAGSRVFEDTGPALPIVATSRGAVATVASAESGGRVVVLADATPLQNRLLGRADNAALAARIAGPPARPVVFVESVHGYGEAIGLAALPSRWWWTLGGVCVAALLLMWARGRRLGGAEAEERELPPPRRLYVESLGALVARSRAAPELVAPLQARARRLLARRAGLPDSDPTQADIAVAAVRAGIPAGEAHRLLSVPGDMQAAIEVGKAYAELVRRQGGGV
jgi:hypothetical protein